MPETLLAEDRQRCGDAVQNTFDVDVDHLLPILHTQVVEGRNAHNAVRLTFQLDEVGQLFASFYVYACIGGFTARIRDAGRQGLKSIRSTRPQHDLGAALSEQERSRLTSTGGNAASEGLA
jgi:hypothetical protein